MKRHESRSQRVTEIAYAITRNQLPLDRHKKSPHWFTWPQLAACILVMFYLDISYCDREDMGLDCRKFQIIRPFAAPFTD
jgi:hypothetical protein